MKHNSKTMRVRSGSTEVVLGASAPASGMLVHLVCALTRVPDMQLGSKHAEAERVLSDQAACLMV